MLVLLCVAICLSLGQAEPLARILSKQDWSRATAVEKTIFIQGIKDGFFSASEEAFKHLKMSDKLVEYLYFLEKRLINLPTQELVKLIDEIYTREKYQALPFYYIMVGLYRHTDRTGLYSELDADLQKEK